MMQKFRKTDEQLMGSGSADYPYFYIMLAFGKDESICFDSFVNSYIRFLLFGEPGR
jgi:hypothetical protein